LYNLWPCNQNAIKLSSDACSVWAAHPW